MCFRFEFRDSGIKEGLYKKQVSAESMDPKTGSRLGLIKLIPFESHLKRMSVLCEQSDGSVQVFCKGQSHIYIICSDICENTCDFICCNIFATFVAIFVTKFEKILVAT